MRVFAAGSTGAIGRRLVPLLLESGHEVVALVRTPSKTREVEAVGAKAVVADALERGYPRGVVSFSPVLPVMGTDQLSQRGTHSARFASVSAHAAPEYG
jgi:nucleoside-diphosphate-sugar epimerase